MRYRTLKPLAILALGALGLSLTLWVILSGDGAVSASVMGAEARERRDALISGLTDGTVLYRKYAHYRPKARTHASLKNPGTWWELTQR